MVQPSRTSAFISKQRVPSVKQAFFPIAYSKAAGIATTFNFTSFYFYGLRVSTSSVRFNFVERNLNISHLSTPTAFHLWNRK